MTAGGAARHTIAVRWSAGLLLAGSGLAYLYTQDPHRAGAYPQCIFFRLTGHYCPGCGGTRAAHDLLHGDWVAAMHENALLVPLLLTAVTMGVHAFVTRRSDGRRSSAVQARVGIAVIAVLVAFGVVRNLPGMEWLRPQ